MSLKTINKTKINPDLFHDTFQAMWELPEKDRASFEGRLFGMLHFLESKNISIEPALVLAITARQHALATFISRQDIPVYFAAKTETPDVLMIHPAVIRAAALEPVIEEDRQWSFGPNFRDRMLLVMEAQGVA